MHLTALWHWNWRTWLWPAKFFCFLGEALCCTSVNQSRKQRSGLTCRCPCLSSGLDAHTDTHTHTHTCFSITWGIRYFSNKQTGIIRRPLKVCIVMYMACDYVLENTQKSRISLFEDIGAEKLDCKGLFSYSLISYGTGNIRGNTLFLQKYKVSKSCCAFAQPYFTSFKYWRLQL